MTKRRSSVSRRTFLTGAASGLASVGVLTHTANERVQARSSSPSEHWRQYRATAANTAHLANSSAPTGNVTEAWKDSDGRFTDGIAVVDGTVYTGLRALDATDGTERWSIDPTIPDYDYPDAPIADGEYPAIMGGTVYITVRFGPYDADEAYAGALIAVDAHTGNKRWRIDTPNGLSRTQFHPVTATKETIYTHGPALDNGDGNWLYAFAPDGSIRWKRRTDTLPRSPLTVADGCVYLPSKKGVRALDGATGKTVWTALPRVVTTATPVVSNGTLFVIEGGEPGVTLIALDAAKGEEHWRTAYSSSTDQPSLSVGTVDAERVYVHVGGDTIAADVIALDRTDGSEHWRATIPQPPKKDGNQLTAVPTEGFARVGDLLYVGGAALHPANGSVIWTHAVPTPWIFGRWLSAVAGGRVYLGGEKITVLSGTTDQRSETPTQVPTLRANTATASPTTSETATETAPATTVSPTPTTTAASMTTTTTRPSATSTPTGTQSTATNGPGFGVLTALGGIGLGAWQALAHRDEK